MGGDQALIFKSKDTKDERISESPLKAIQMK
jgi:hypothetical protein